MSNFKSSVLKVVSNIPQGKVMSYGQVALCVGMPRAARQVGWVLNQLDGELAVPWWRVVNNSGRISIKGSFYSASEQKDLLIGEGVDVDDDLTFDIVKYRYEPSLMELEDVEIENNYAELLSKSMPLRKK